MTDDSSLKPVHVKKLLDAAKKESYFDYVAIKTLVLLGVHRASLVGQNDPRSRANPGMLIENLTPDGIMLIEGHQTEKVFRPLSPDLRADINRVIGSRTVGKIFPRTTGWLWYRIEHYAKKADVSVPIGDNELKDFSEKYRPFLPTVIENPKFFEHPAKAPESPERKLKQESEPQAQNPRDVLDMAFVTLKSSLSQEILDRLKKCPPRFFEENVLELLVKMGYGSRDDAEVTGRTGDEGIDGIIKLDKLGLRLLAFQAKRWKGTVGSAEVRDFVGSLDGLRAREGIFFSTSHFSKDARDWSNKTEKKIVLIDGEQLATLMIDYDVGVDADKTLVIKKINKDYFE